MSISVIVPVWNGRELLERLLASVDAQTERPLEILAVDNGSTDGAAEVARAHGARVISMGRNAGFAAATNRGIAESRGDWIAALNSDVELAPDYLSVLRRAAESEQAWFATGKLFATRRPKYIDGTFDCLCLGGAAWRAGSGRLDSPVFSKPAIIHSAPWTAAIFRSELFRRVGTLDEHFESYLEDVDFGVRCAMRGYTGVYEPRAVGWHRGSAALGAWSATAVRLISRNQILLIAKHYPAPLLRAGWWPIVVAQTLWLGVALKHGAGLAWLRGKFEGCRRFSTTRESRDSWSATAIREFLEKNESDILSFQNLSGFDLFWKMYFLLTGRAAK